MSRATAWTLHVAVMVMALTGLWLAWLVLFATPPVGSDAEVFAVASPQQPWLTALHIIAGPVLVFAVGFIWHQHVRPRLAYRGAQRRLSGIWLLVVFAPLVLGGYALQVAEDETVRAALSWTHAAAGALFAVCYAVHLVVRPAGVRMPENGAQNEMSREHADTAATS